MTGDELAARLYAEQGYFLSSSSYERSVGEIVTTATLEGQILCPLRVVGTGTKEELTAQRKRQVELAGEDNSDLPWHPGRYIYRVEAAD